MRTCIPEARKLILSRLSARHLRNFTDVWEFLRFARKENPGVTSSARLNVPDARCAIAFPETSCNVGRKLVKLL